MKKGLLFSVYSIATAIFLILLDYSTIICFYVTLCAMFVLFFADVIIDKEWKLIKPLLWSCLGGFLLFIFYISLGNVHICQTDEGKIEVYSPLCTRTLITEATATDTLVLNSSLERWYDQLSPNQTEFYLVYKDDGSVHVFNRMKEVMVADSKELSISQRVWRGIPIDVLKIRDDYYDLNGQIINESWHPYISDVTPVDPNL